MRDKLLKRLQELSEELETHIKEREFHVDTLRRLDARIKELSILIPELDKLAKEDS